MRAVKVRAWGVGKGCKGLNEGNSTHDFTFRLHPRTSPSPNTTYFSEVSPSIPTGPRA